MEKSKFTLAIFVGGFLLLSFGFLDFRYERGKQDQFKWDSETNTYAMKSFAETLANDLGLKNPKVKCPVNDHIYVEGTAPKCTCTITYFQDQVVEKLSNPIGYDSTDSAKQSAKRVLLADCCNYKCVLVKAL